MILGYLINEVSFPQCLFHVSVLTPINPDLRHINPTGQDENALVFDYEGPLCTS